MNNKIVWFINENQSCNLQLKQRKPMSSVAKFFLVFINCKTVTEYKKCEGN